MNKRNSIQIKAAFLLTIFALNTIVGFACNMGVEMGFNSKHHSDEETVPVIHIHADGKEHIHYEKKKESHADSNKHEHEKPGKQDHGKKPHHDDSNSNTKEDSKENCCKDQVLKFEQIDKAVAKVFSFQVPIFAVCFFNDFYKDALYASEVAPKIKYFVRSYHPPIADIRVAIQSFQI